MIAAIAYCLVLTSCGGDKEFDKSMEYLNSLETQLNDCTTKDQWIEFYIEFNKEVKGNARYENPPKGLYKSEENRKTVMLKTAQVAALGLKKEAEVGIKVGTEMYEVVEYAKRKQQMQN